MAIIIDGKHEAALLRDEVARGVGAFKAEHGIAPGLTVVIVGDNPASRAYVRTKTKVAAAVGVDGRLVELPDAATTEDLLAVVDGLNRDAGVHGILVQLPLPGHVDTGAVLEAIHPAKDVDGFHPLNAGKLFSAQRGIPGDLLIPCTPWGCLRLLERSLGKEGLSGKNAVVLGRSNIVGKPMAALLLAANCTVTVAHSRTLDPETLCRSADVLVAAIGRPRHVPGAWVKEGAAVIDVGINRVDDGSAKGRLVGDVDFEAAKERAGWITPVPGGVGPMTVASLMRNTLVAARGQARL